MNISKHSFWLRKLPLKYSLDLTILGMGLLTITLILLTGEAYRRLAIDSQQNALAAIISVQAAEVMDKLSEQSRDLGSTLQRNPALRQALQSGDQEQLARIAATPFNQYFVNTGIIKLHAVWIFDEQFNVLSSSDRFGTSDNLPICPGLLHDARKRIGHQRLRPMQQTCTIKGRALFAQLVPIGLLPIGYVLVISDPTHNLKQLEKSLHFPITLLGADNKRLYRSPNWLTDIQSSALLEAQYTLPSQDEQAGIKIKLQGDFLPFYERLERIQKMIIALALTATLLTMLIARYVTRKIVLDPIQYLSHQLRRSGAGRRLADQASDNVVAVHEFTELQELYSALQDMALTDPLTHLPNRLQFERRLEKLVASALQNNDQHILCYLDLDQFKIINDSCGHAAGDLLLQQLAEIFSTDLRSIDLFARIGGDEFALLLEHCSTEDAMRIAQKIRASVENYQFFWSGRCFSIGVSIGVVPIHAGTGNTSRILSLADASCYVAKKHGRNHVHLYRENDTEIAERNTAIQWAARIHAALSENRFRLFCQPVYACEKHLAIPELYEVLVWMQSETGTLIEPSEFITVAERHNLILRIDYWVVSHTLEWLRSNADKIHNTRYSINLSGHALVDEEFLDYLVAKIHSSGVAPEQLCFEITERGASQNFVRAKHFITTLKDIGCLFILDDFGIGVASFTYLQTVGINYLKIDGHVIQNTMQSEIGRQVVEAVIQMGRSLHIPTIAECVETEDIFNCLHDLNVNYVQGYFLAKPCPIEQTISAQTPATIPSSKQKIPASEATD